LDPGGGWFYINPSRRGPVPVPGVATPRPWRPARRVSHSGVEVAEREPMGSRRDGLLVKAILYTTRENSTKK